MTYTEIKTKLQETGVSLGVLDYELELHADFRDQGMDSLDVVEFCMAIERDLGIVLPDSDLVKVNTPHQLIELIILRNHMSEIQEPPTI